jgi:hypothetical protein
MKAVEDRRRYGAAHALDGAMDRSVLVETCKWTTAPRTEFYENVVSKRKRWAFRNRPSRKNFSNGIGETQRDR